MRWSIRLASVQPVAFTLTNPTSEAGAVYVIVDDPGWMSSKANPYTLTFKPDGSFEPARLEVPAGRFKIVLVNQSKQAVEFESLPLRAEKVLGPGVKSFVVLSLSKPGEYPFFDDFHPQVKGTLVVVPRP